MKRSKVVEHSLADPNQQLIETIFLQPWYLPKKIAVTIQNMLPPDHKHKMHFYFEDYGCLKCGRRNVPYGANALCRKCLHQAVYRFFFAIRRRWNWQKVTDAYASGNLHRIANAQKLLRKLVVAAEQTERMRVKRKITVTGHGVSGPHGSR